mmetsp:Transcript_5748/g.10147  ORF Transcript_5748/g.10147 Transcript_5748/m.10147 type:complete len:95 (+) Transcript_5748:2173-2457(+)
MHFVQPVQHKIPENFDLKLLKLLSLGASICGIGSTSDAQNAHLHAACGISDKQNGQSRFGISSLRCTLRNGTTTKKNTTAEIIKNEIDALINVP